MLCLALTTDLLFSEAFDTWISHRVFDTQGRVTAARFIGAKTETDYRVCAKALEQYFGAYRLAEIDVPRIMDYQQLRNLNPPNPRGEWRCHKGKALRGPFATEAEAARCAEKLAGEWTVTQTLWAHPAGSNRIRKEVDLLLRILKSAKLWDDEKKQALLRLRAEESGVQRALTTEEQHRLLHVAAMRPEWQLIHQYCIVALQTTASTNELRALRLGDVFLGPHPYIQIPRAGAKNKYRMRTIPLVTRDAEWAMEGLVARAQRLGSSGPGDYLFPIQKHRGEYDPSRPMTESGLKKPWDEVRKAAGLPRLRIYDLRHTGITRMAESNVPLPVAMSFAGHMTRKMQEHYQAICIASKRGWGELVWGDPLQAAAVPEVAEAWPQKKLALAERSRNGRGTLRAG